MNLRTKALRAAVGAAPPSIVCIAAFAFGAPARGQADGVPTTTLTLQWLDLSGDLELVRLVELVTQRLDVSVQYQPKDLSQRVTLRLREPLNDEELWRVLTATLESQGLAIVETEQEGLFRIVPLAQAAAAHQALALPGEGMQAQPRATFVSAVVRLRSLDPSEAATALTPLLTPQTGTVKALGAGRLLLIADVRRRVEQALALLEQLDAPPETISSFIVELEHAAPEEVATLLQQALLARQSLDPRSAAARSPTATGTGALGVPLPDGRRLMVVAAASRADELRRLIAEFDVRPALELRTYAAAGVPLEDLAATLRELLSSGGAARTAEAPRVFVDRLTGAIIVHATARDHARVAEFIERVNAAPPTSRRVMRSFVIRNRSAADLQATLQSLLAEGLVALGAPAEDYGARGMSSSRDSGGLRASDAAALAATADQAGGAPPPAAAPTVPRGDRSGVPLALTLDQPTNTLIGVGDPSLLDQLEELVRLLDRRQPQVMIEATLVTMSEGEALDIGVELRGQFEIGSTSVDLSSLFGLTSMSGALGAGTGLTGVIINPGDFQALVRAVESVNEGRTLSSPKALANNNATTTLRAVNRQPFTSINASDTVATTSFGGTEDAGTTITVTPQIAEGDHLLLDYSVELSAFTGESTTTQDGGVIPPPSQQNSVEGSVTIPDGYTVVIGGVDDRTYGKSTTRVPLIGRIPILGALFGTTGRSETRSRFYVFIRATVLRDPGFEDLRTLSGPDLADAGVWDGTPALAPIWIE